MLLTSHILAHSSDLNCNGIHLFNWFLECGIVGASNSIFECWGQHSSPLWPANVDNRSPPSNRCDKASVFCISFYCWLSPLFLTLNMLFCNRYAVQQSFILGGLGKVNLIVLTAHTQNSSASFYVFVSWNAQNGYIQTFVSFSVFFNVMYWY